MRAVPNAQVAKRKVQGPGHASTPGSVNLRGQLRWLVTTCSPMPAASIWTFAEFGRRTLTPLTVEVHPNYLFGDAE